MTAKLTGPRYEARTFCQGEPPAEYGGGMPRTVVAVVMDHQLGRASVRVIIGGSGLGVVNRSDGRGNQPVEAGDDLHIVYIRGTDALSLLMRAGKMYHWSACDRSGEWREVTEDRPYWDGREFAGPVAAPTEVHP